VISRTICRFGLSHPRTSIVLAHLAGERSAHPEPAHARAGRAAMTPWGRSTVEPADLAPERTLDVDPYCRVTPGERQNARSRFSQPTNLVDAGGACTTRSISMEHGHELPHRHTDASNASTNGRRTPNLGFASGRSMWRASPLRFPALAANSVAKEAQERRRFGMRSR